MKHLISLACALALTATVGATAPHQSMRNVSHLRAAALAEGDLPGTTEEHQDAWNSVTAEERTAILNVFRDNVVTPVANQEVQVPDPTPAPDPEEQLPIPNAAATAASASQRDLLSGFDLGELLNLLSTAANPVQGFATGNDGDADGLPESFENQVVSEFMPEYHVSAGERSDVGFSRFKDQPTPLEAINPPERQRPPLVHARVAGLGGKSEGGVLYGYLRVDYLTLWNRDSGYDPDFLCENASGPFLGLARKEHENDVERSAALVAAPVVWTDGRATYNPDPAAYRAFYQFTTAHEDYAGTRESRTYRVVPPSAPGDHASLRVYLSKSKHGTYAFNPDGHTVLIPELRLLVYGATYFFALKELILDTLGGRPPPIAEVIGFAFAFMFDIFLTDCLRENFEEQGADN